MISESNAAGDAEPMEWVARIFFPNHACAVHEELMGAESWFVHCSYSTCNDNRRTTHTCHWQIQLPKLQRPSSELMVMSGHWFSAVPLSSLNSSSKLGCLVHDDGALHASSGLHTHSIISSMHLEWKISEPNIFARSMSAAVRAETAGLLTWGSQSAQTKNMSGSSSFSFSFMIFQPESSTGFPAKGVQMGTHSRDMCQGW